VTNRNIIQDHTVESLKEKSETEPVANYLGMRLIEISEGYSKVRMVLRPEHLNFNGLIFGGIIMCLADLAFAYATNSMGTPNVASQFNIHFIAGASAGDELSAECHVIKRGNRVCHSEIKVSNRDGKLIAQATGVTIPLTKNK